MSMLVLGDALEVLRAMPGGSANQLLTSPPYYWQRDYGVRGQIGRERTAEEFLARLLAVFDEGRRVLTEDGICCVNLGDKYLDGCLQLIPHRFAAGMKERGWIVLNDVTWHKVNCKPESVRSRFGCDAEAIFVFAKSRRHYFAKQYEPYSPRTVERIRQFCERKERFDASRHKQDKDRPSQAPMLLLERIAKNLVVPGQSAHGMHVARANGDNRDVFDGRGRGVRSVWPLPVARYAGAHFAVWPFEVPRRLILAGCPPGGTVLDPFTGVGTSVVVAEGLDRTGIGIDINPEYLELARRNVLAARENRARAMEKAARSGRRHDGNRGEDERRAPASSGDVAGNREIPEIFEEI
jgi:site-specific DNA-methyltransferase (adenine-specific)